MVTIKQIKRFTGLGKKRDKKTYKNIQKEEKEKEKRKELEEKYHHAKKYGYHFKKGKLVGKGKDIGDRKEAQKQQAKNIDDYIKFLSRKDKTRIDFPSEDYAKDYEQRMIDQGKQVSRTDKTVFIK